MRKLAKLFSVMLVFSMLVSACGGSGASDEKFRVAVVTPSAKNDLAFSQSIYESLLKVQQAMGGPEKMEFVISENMFVVDDAGSAIRDYASQGYNLIIAHGSQYGGVLQEIAPDFPKTSFAHGTTVDTFVDKGISNVFAYEARSEQGGYVNGVMAGALTKSNIIGVVGPIETGDAKLYVDGFIAGVKAQNPNAQVNVNWIGSFSDVALASEAAQTHVKAGADVMAGTAQMVVGAIGVAKDNKVLWFGTQASQTSLAPDVVVANQIYDWSGVITQIIDLIGKGTYGGQAFEITLENKGLYVDYNSAYALPAEVKQLAEATVNAIITGAIKVAP